MFVGLNVLGIKVVGGLGNRVGEKVVGRVGLCVVPVGGVGNGVGDSVKIVGDRVVG